MRRRKRKTFKSFCRFAQNRSSRIGAPPYMMNAGENCHPTKYITRHSCTKVISHRRIRHPKFHNMLIWHSEMIPVNHFNIPASDIDFSLFLYYHKSMKVTFVLRQFSFSNFRSSRDETIFNFHIAYSLMRILRTYHQLSCLLKHS